MNCSVPLFIPREEAGSAARHLLQRITEERPLFRKFQQRICQHEDLQSLSERKIQKLVISQTELAAKRADYRVVFDALVQVGPITPDLDKKIRQIGRRLTKLDEIAREIEPYFSSFAHEVSHGLQQDRVALDLFQFTLSRLDNQDKEIPIMPYEASLTFAKQWAVFVKKRIGHETKLALLNMLSYSYPALEPQVFEISEHLRQFDRALQDSYCQIPDLEKSRLPYNISGLTPKFVKEGDQIVRNKSADLGPALR